MFITVLLEPIHIERNYINRLQHVSLAKKAELIHQLIKPCLIQTKNIQRLLRYLCQKKSFEIHNQINRNQLPIYI
jgi:hypothetical protein